MTPPVLPDDGPIGDDLAREIVAYNAETQEETPVVEDAPIEVPDITVVFQHWQHALAESACGLDEIARQLEAIHQSLPQQLIDAGVPAAVIDGPAAEIPPSPY